MILKESSGLNTRYYRYLVDFENNFKVIKICIAYGRNKSIIQCTITCWDKNEKRATSMLK